MRRLPILILLGSLALANCGKTYGNADCVETVQTEQGERPSIVRAHTDENNNGTVDRVYEFVCKTRPGSFGLDEDCRVNKTHLLDNSYSNYHARRYGGLIVYSEIGKRTPMGRSFQKNFEACKAKGSE